MTSKSIHVPCPPYKLSSISEPIANKERLSEEQEPIPEANISFNGGFNTKTAQTEKLKPEKEKSKEKIIETAAKEKSESQEQNNEDMPNEELTEVTIK